MVNVMAYMYIYTKWYICVYVFSESLHTSHMIKKIGYNEDEIVNVMTYRYIYTVWYICVYVLSKLTHTSH